MSVATVITLGYGDFGSVNFIPTLGYGGGDPTYQPGTDYTPTETRAEYTLFMPQIHYTLNMTRTEYTLEKP